MFETILKIQSVLERGEISLSNSIRRNFVQIYVMRFDWVNLINNK